MGAFVGKEQTTGRVVREWTEEIKAPNGDLLRLHRTQWSSGVMTERSQVVDALSLFLEPAR